MACIPPNPRRLGYIDPIHGLTYTPTLLAYGNTTNKKNKTFCFQGSWFCRDETKQELPMRTYKY